MARIEQGSKVHDLLSIIDAAESRKVNVPYNIFVYDVSQRAKSLGFLVNYDDDDNGGMGLSKLGIQVLKALNKGGFYDDKADAIGSADEMAGIQARLDKTNARKMIRALINRDNNVKYYEWYHANGDVQDMVVLDVDAVKVLLKYAKKDLTQYTRWAKEQNSDVDWPVRVAAAELDIARFEKIVRKK